MRRFSLPLFAAAGLLAGCANGQLNPQTQAMLANVCQKDAQLQPLVAADVQTALTAAAVIGAAIPQVQVVDTAVGVAVAVDNAKIHPFIQDLCKQFAPAVAAAPATPAKPS